MGGEGKGRKKQKSKRRKGKPSCWVMLHPGSVPPTPTRGPGVKDVVPTPPQKQEYPPPPRAGSSQPHPEP